MTRLRPHRRLAVAAVAVAAASALTTATLVPDVAARPVAAPGLAALSGSGPSVSLGFTGDMGGNANTGRVLDAIPANGLQAFVALGDLSYSEITPESGWCAMVQSHVGATYPFELLAGNHEDDGPDGLISNFAQCLPDRLGVTGDYPRQYYVDYPAGVPLVRLVMISPRLTFPPSTSAWSYSATSSHYAWTKSAIEGARAAGIPWVVVGMHEYCLSLVNYPCATGTDIMNLLVSEHVDLYLQAHDHGYSRTKQLALTDGCTAIDTTSFDPACVADASASSAYTAGAGTVIATVGSGGRSLNSEYPSLPQGGYFQTAMGSNISPTYGLLRVDADATTLSASYVAGTSGGFTDSFTLTKPATTSPSPTATTTSPSPTASTTSASPAASTTSASPSPSPTTTASSTELAATADTWVGSDAPTTTHGTDQALYADGSPTKVTYLKFDTSGLAGRTLTAAQLRVTTTSGAYSGSPGTEVVHAVTDTTWTESAMTYDTRPAVSSSSLGSVAGTSSATAYSITLDPVALQPLLGGLVSLAVDTTGGDAFYVGSRESATPPVLVLRTG